MNKKEKRCYYWGIIVATLLQDFFLIFFFMIGFDKNGEYYSRFGMGAIIFVFILTAFILWFTKVSQKQGKNENE